MVAPTMEMQMPHRRLIADWDSAYANVPNIPEGASFPPGAAQAQAFRATLGERLVSGIPYGPHERQAFDLVRPEGEAKGLVIFIHGGYWMRFHRTDWTHLAAGPLAHGHAVAFPSYRLCPEVPHPGHRGRRPGSSRGRGSDGRRSDHACRSLGRRTSRHASRLFRHGSRSGDHRQDPPCRLDQRRARSLGRCSGRS